MNPCPGCNSRSNIVARFDSGLADYICQECDHAWSTVEVPEPYLRDLIARSLELAALKARALP